MDLDAQNLVDTHDDIQLAHGVEPVSEELEQKPFGSNSVEHDLLRPIGHSKMIGDEDELFNEGIHSAGIASNAMNNKRSIRYLHHDEDGNPVGALQIMTHGPRSKKATIQNVYVAQDNRRQKIATGLLKRARQDYDVKHSKELTEQGSAFAKYTKSYGGGVPSYIPEERVEDLARRLITFSYAVAPLVPRVKGTYAEGGSVDDAQNAVDVARNLNPMGFYSAAAEAASKFPQKAPIDQIVNKIKGQPNVKKEELDNANLADAFAGQRSVDPQEVARHLQASVPQIREQVYGGKHPVKYNPKPMLYHPEEFEDADEVHRIGPEGQPPHYIVKEGEDYHVYGPSGYHATYNSLSDAKDHANNSINKIEQPLYKEYTTPGGKNYREVVMHLPEEKEASAKKVTDFYDAMHKKYGEDFISKISPEEDIALYRLQSMADVAESKQPYKSSHWQGVDNPLAHLRMSDRDNGKTLHIEELQSDWGQEGRKKGFSDDRNFSDEDAKEFKSLNDRYLRRENLTPEEADRLDTLADAQRKYVQGVPSAPYVTDTNQWVDLGLKRALMEAAKGGYDKLVWTPGEQQAARYDLSKQIDRLVYNPNAEILMAYKDGKQIINRGAAKNELEGIVGKDVAKNLLASEGQALPDAGSTKYHILEGQELAVGGEGMKSFYDKLVPQRLNKLVSQYDKDAKVAPHSHSLQGEDGEVKAHAIQITPKLRAAILKGLPAFKSGGDVGYDRGGSIIRRALDVISKLPQ